MLAIWVINVSFLLDHGFRLLPLSSPCTFVLFETQVFDEEYVARNIVFYPYMLTEDAPEDALQSEMKLRSSKPLLAQKVRVLGNVVWQAEEALSCSV